MFSLRANSNDQNFSLTSLVLTVLSGMKAAWPALWFRVSILLAGMHTIGELKRGRKNERLLTWVQPIAFPFPHRQSSDQEQPRHQSRQGHERTGLASLSDRTLPGPCPRR
jgi:hypothetical protein